jgi:glycosyltransferase involved in cell wall biosynthesis
MKPVVLLLSIYPFAEPRHGGQVRVSNIANVFRAAGWQVESIAVYKSEGYEARSVFKNDLPFPVNSHYRLFRGCNEPYAYDLQAGEYAVAEDGGFLAILARLPQRIDAIHVEQPGLWPLAAKIKTMRKYEYVVLIYGSQNIEAPLRREIFPSYSARHDVDDVINAVDALERRAASEADLTLAVTEADLNILAGYGAKELLLAPNGIAPWTASPATLELWRARLPEVPWILYVASAHPPNFTGFTACIGDSLGCISPESRLVVAGGVCKPLCRSLAATRWHSLNLSRLELLYILSDEDLAAVKTLAHAFLLPIQHGGGSNIKTAEALYSGAYVIGSEVAFRGFEDVASLPEVMVARSPKEFQIAIRDVLQRPPHVHVEPVQGDCRYRLRWDQCLASIPETVARVMAKRVEHA